MNGLFDFAYSAKAWVAAAVAAVGNVVTLIQVAAADEAISLTEARGIWIGITGAATVLASGYAVWQKRNAPAPAA